MYMQDTGDNKFLIHCTRDADYTTEIMSMHGVFDEIQVHSTWQMVNSEWKRFKCAEPFSPHNHMKYWVDDVNHHCHSPIALKNAWAMKWWPNCHLPSFVLWQR